MRRICIILTVVGLVLLLSACSPQKALNEADRLCRDGVEYLSYEKMSSNGTLSYSIVPHFKPDGSLYTCGGAA